MKKISAVALLLVSLSMPAFAGPRDDDSPGRLNPVRRVVHFRGASARQRARRPGASQAVAVYRANDEYIKRLNAADAGAPAGRLDHACYGADDRLRASDVWESKESFGNFGSTLMPILEIGIDAGVPEIVEAHNVVRG